MQKVVSLNIEAKYRGIIIACIETVWIHNPIRELQYSIEKFKIVYYDNQSTMHVVETLLLTTRSMQSFTIII